MSNKVRLGVIGAGVIGNVHMRVARQEPEIIDLVAVADLREDIARERAKEHQVSKVYTSAEALLADKDIGAVILALPTVARKGLAEKAFGAGKHVLVEKPAAFNADELRAMIRARGDRVAACCSARLRFTNIGRKAAEIVSSGALGALRSVRCRAISSAGAFTKVGAPWRLKRAQNGGGILVNWGTYDLDFLLGTTGWSLKPLHALARTWTVPPQFANRVAEGSDAETYVNALVSCADGISLDYERGEYMPAAKENQWEFIGTRASLRVPIAGLPGAQIMLDETTPQEGVKSVVAYEVPAEGDVDYHRCVVADFARAILERRPPATTLEQGLLIQRITDAIYASADNNAPVAFS